MEFSPCPRCRKLVPNEASFCRRCGVAVRQGVSRAARSAQPAPEPRLGNRWASTVSAAATASLGVVLALFAVSGPRVAIRHGERPNGFDRLRDVPDPPPERREGADRDADESRLPALRTRPVPARRLTGGTNPAPVDVRNPLRATGPEITSVVGTQTGYGYKVAVFGNRLGGARRVLFIGTERGHAETRFSVRNDHHLLASVPDLGRWPQDATVAVETDDGVAFTVPAGAPDVDNSLALTPRGTVCVVPSGGVFAGADPSVVFVERGAAARAATGATFFVRRGGCLWGRGGGDCLVYCEPGVLPRSDLAACTVIEVDAVNPCVVPALFHYDGR